MARVLKGSGLRYEASRVLVRKIGTRTPIHYRDWYDLVRQEGYLVLGRRPAATFLTAVSRSPVVAPTGPPGMYAVVPDLLEVLSTRLTDLREKLAQIDRHEEFHGKILSPGLRQERRRLLLSHEKLQRQLEEGTRVLEA